MQTPAACPACGGPLEAWRSVPSSEPLIAPGHYQLARCGRCGTAVTTGPPVPGLYDAGAYRPGAPRLSRLARPVLDLFDRQRLSLVRSLAPPPARLLDAGAGRGRFVAAARAAGYDAFGIDPSARGAEAGSTIATPVRRAGIENATIDPSSVDVVTLWHVLEHLEEPGAALARIHGWLRPGGCVLVGVPNLDSLQAQLGGAGWYHLDVPRHRTHFTARGLNLLLRARGFEPVRTQHLLIEHNPFGMWQSLVNRLTARPSYLYNLLKRNAPPSARELLITAAAAPLVPVAAAAELGAGLLGRGGTIATLARREQRSGGEYH